MGDDWKKSAALCGNCRHWPLAQYQHDWKGAEPQGIAGYGTDGTVSDCRRNAPIAIGPVGPGRTAIWPKTEKRDNCGDFERRPERRQSAAPRVKPRRQIQEGGKIKWMDA